MKKFWKVLCVCLVVLVGGCLLTACGSNIKLTINFDSNGGSECQAIYYEVGKSFNMPADPTRENYIFDGWYEDNGTWETPFTVSTVLNYPLSSNMSITVYAKWIQKANVVFDSNGGSECEKIYIDSANATLPTPTKEGYRFDGWYLDNGTFENEYVLGNEYELDEENSITVYAKWNLVRYLVFDSNGGTELEKMDIEDVNEETLPTPTKYGYTFCGWYIDTTFNIPFNLDDLSNYFSANQSELTILAKWEYDKTIKNVTFYGTPKTQYYYGDEFDANGMYAIIEYNQHESEQVGITTDYISGFYTTRISTDTSVTELKGTICVSVEGYCEYFSYTVTPKYKSISIKENSIQTEYVIGENTSTIYRTCTTCSGSYYFCSYQSKYVFKCTIIVTNFDGTTEEINLIVYTDEDRTLSTKCTHDGFQHDSSSYKISLLYAYAYTFFVGHENIEIDTITSEYFVCLIEDNEFVLETTNAYCTLSTNSVGEFTATLYYGLCSVDFNYKVDYADSTVSEFEQSEYVFIKELVDNDTTLLGETLTITLANGRVFKWKIDSKDYIMCDFNFSTTGDKEAIVCFPYQSSGSYACLKIKYKVIALSEIDYIDLGSFEQSDETYNQYYVSQFYYTVDDEECYLYYYYYLGSENAISLDVSETGEFKITTEIAGVNVTAKYKVTAKTSLIFVDSDYYNQLSDYSIYAK